VLNLDGTEYAAFSTTGVAETSVLGTYRKASGVVCPDAGAYIVWGVSGTDYAEATVEPMLALQPSTPGRTLGISEDGAAWIDWASIDNSDTEVDLSGTTIKTATDVETATTAILARLGAWTGTARNTILGALQAMFRKDADAAVPSDINVDLGSGAGVANNTTDSLEALRDNTGTAGAGLTALGDTRMAYLDAPVSEAGGGLTAQETVNAVHNLAPTGVVAANSIGDKLNDILAVTDALDVSAVTHVTVNDAGVLTITRTLSFSTTLSGLDIPADWEACYWTVKRSTDDPDAEALVQILESNPGDGDDGVQVLAGEAVEDGSDGSLTVNQAGGTVAIVLGDASTALLEDAVELVWDVKFHYPAGKTQPGAGTATITTAVTRA